MKTERSNKGNYFPGGSFAGYLQPRRLLQFFARGLAWVHLFSLLAGFSGILLLAQTVQAAPCDTKSGFSFVRHDLSESYCELCGYGYITVVISNPYSYTYDTTPPFTDPPIPGATITNMVLVENLGSSGLVYDPTAPNPFSVSVNGTPVAVLAPPGTSGTTLTFSSAQTTALDSLVSGEGAQVNTITLRFAVRRTSDPEGLASPTTNRTVTATLTFDTDSGCSDSPRSDTDSLALREPEPEVIKTGWNYDAGQRSNSASNPVYGNNNDDVVWRIRINNPGDAGLQDLRLDDLMEIGNLEISHVCTTEGAANTIAANNGGGALPAGCVAHPSNDLSNFIVSDPYGDMASSYDGYEVDVTAGGTTSIYLVGKIISDGSCSTSTTNTVSNVQWGCEAQVPAGDISQTSSGSTVPTEVATLYTRYNDDHPLLEVQRQLTGTNTSQPVGSKGTMTITIRNNSGGSVKNIHLKDVLPVEYVVDSTFPPELDVYPEYGAYPGLIDTIVWTNPAGAGNPLANTAPEFDLTSNGVTHPLYADQVNMLRQGDVAVVRFRVVLIESDYYDRSANLDVNPEEYPVTQTDPTHQTILDNELTVDFDLFCGTQGSQQFVLTGNGTGNPNGAAIPANPEDLDVAVGGNVFILTNDPAQLLTLPILVTNNGGHDAADYHTFVSFGATMEVVSAPSDCSPISLDANNQPAPWKVWLGDPADPLTIPSTATVYSCSSTDVIAPGQTVTYNFDVRKVISTDSNYASRLAADDLSLRADVVGEIVLSDGTTLLDFPAPILRADNELDRANNYSLDTTWARVIGFNLKKNQVGTCSENNPPSFDNNGFEEVQIGEECTFHLETGGWFGFKTPGFAYIAVQNIDVVDEVPDGQVYISSADAGSTSLIQGVALTLPGAPITEGQFDWRFNVPDSQQIKVADEWFVVDTTTRLLNKEIDQRLAPNLHAANSHNILTSDFDATFMNNNTGAVEMYTLGPSTVGYPEEAIRRVDLTVTEPYLTLEKQVCNESLSTTGTGSNCTPFVDLADNGDAYNDYVYRIVVTNEASSDGVQRAPAYDVIVTDELDPSDLAYVYPLSGDGIDNDGDGSSDEAGGEGSISDNVVKNAAPAVVTFSYTHSSALERIDPGSSVTLYYRVDYDDDAAPQQTFTNTVLATYDSLEGEFGSQSAPQRPNSDIAGARFYTSDSTTAQVRIVPVETEPKSIAGLSNTPLVGAGTQGVSVGEEIEYRLSTLLPVALLRNFVIRDELPTGLRCSEAPEVNLDAAPYAAAGFDPGGTITPTCADGYVEWNFGDQRLTAGTAGLNNRFDFEIGFIARVENTSSTNDGDTLSNGDPATNATATYVDESGNSVTYDFGQVDVEVHEPLIELTKNFAVPNADAADILTVTVTATNNGTATAYNLRVLEDLTGLNLTYVGNVAGTSPPDVVDTTTLGVKRPIFSWSAPIAIDVGDSISFTFDISIDALVQPLEVLENTIQADWTSLPGQSTALNSVGSIGADGTEIGMRIGALPNAGDSVNDYETDAAAQVPVPALTVTKTDLEPATVPTIGAHKRFSIEVALPEGISNGVIVTDSLDAAGLSYVLANNATYDISYSFSGIATINGQPPNEAVFSSFPADGSTGTVTWDIGTVVTQTEDDSSQNLVNPAVRIDYYARVNNDLDTDAGDTLLNGAVLNYLNGDTGLQETLNSAAPSVSVSEPDLTMTKTVENFSNPGAPPVAGDILQYRLTAINTGSTNSTAYDINIVDTLPAGLVLYSGFTPTATIDSVPVPGFVGTPAGAPGGPLTWGRDNGDGSLDIPAGQTLLIIYQTVVQVVLDPAGIIENGVYSDWTSLEGVNTHERTGDGCPTITLPNDYCVGPVFATTTGVAPEMVFQKTVINETTGADPGPTASPGDVLRYRLHIENISTAAGQFNLTDEIDQLNASPLFVPGTLTIVTPPPSGTDNSDPLGGAAGTGLVSFTGLSLDGGDFMTIEFTVQLAAVIPSGTEVLNQGSLLLVDLGTVLSDDPNLGGDDNPTRTEIVSEPDWIIEKSAQDLTGASTILFAGDVLRYTITVKNVGTENAVNAMLRDTVPADTTYVGGSTTLNGTSVADPGPGVSPLAAGILINALENPTPGAMRADATATTDNVATVTFDVQVDAATASGTAISNQGFVGGSGTGSGAFPDQPSDDPATAAADDPTVVVVSSVEFRKTVFNETTGGSGATATPGDTLRYRLEIINTSTGTLNDLSLVDDLESLQAGDPQYFVPGTLALDVVPSGADVSNADPNGGTKGTGLVDIRGMSVASGDTLTVEFTVQLAPIIISGTQVLNQADLIATAAVFLNSDDPNIGGANDPTETLIASAPQFLVEKISTDLTGDPAVLRAGDTLRYTITVKNIGNENAVNVILRDNTPSNTTYVANSTTLNGVAVPDASGGVNPLHSGILINAPENTTAGYMRADASATTDNVATLTFDVVVDAGAQDGLVIENQGFVDSSGEGSGVQHEQPSDDPDTPTADDPTRDVVGDLPLLYALKTVTISQDNGTVGIVDPGDVLRYTIVITNSGAVAASNATLTDTMPSDTTYVANSTTLNGAAVADLAGNSPVTAGLVVQSGDNPGAGIISVGESAEVSFEVTVDLGTPIGTLISNQGSVTCAELSELLTDADGVASNGYQPTVVVVGSVQVLSITKEVTVTGGGSAEPGSELTYVIRVTNIGGLAATDVVVTDDLTPLSGQVTYVSGSGTMDGVATGVTYAGAVLTADYAATYGDLSPGDTLGVRFRVQIDAALPYGTTITNTAEVTWDGGSRNESASVAIDVGGTPGSAALNGSVWHDGNLDTVYDISTEEGQESWTVELYLDGTLITTTTTDGDGNYSFYGLAANDGTGSLYEIRFVAPGAGTNTASLGDAISAFTNGLQRISAITVAEGQNLQDLDLPLWPNGTVYESINREPVAGATLELLNAASGAALPDTCFNDPVQQGQVTTANGFYKFDLNFSDATTCPAGGDYLIEVTQPASGYLSAPSTIINAASDSSTAAYSIPVCSADAVPATADYCEAVTYATAPPVSVAPNSAGTTYYLHLSLDNGNVPGSSQIFNNPIPIDSEMDGAVAITKVAALTNVTRGALVPYTITVTNVYGVPLEDIRVVDRFPAGFKYVDGSARLDGVAAEPAINGQEMVWDGLELAVSERRTFEFLLIVGSGVSEGEYVNRAMVYNTALGTDVSGEATATVRVVPDPDFDCTDVIGKVFDDGDLDGWQDKGEVGLSGIRLVTARGLIATTDQYGRFHIGCATVPDEDRGSNFILKLDERSLPGGYRLTTENPRVQRATRGKMLRFNFGATIHRVVRIDLADGAFEPGTSELRLQWRPKVAQLIEELKRAPSVLHLSYLADLEKEGLVKKRLKQLKKGVAKEWDRSGGGYRLVIETETFWRRGAPFTGR
ncbi:MAG: DUF11 domain-containing protein [Deltaproteobacteria bacterium]|nr:DUF11 domain-containing protein [Deltaproteobacteria bacterium]